MTTVEARVVDPVPSRSVDVTETEMVDAALAHEEDKILVDEEITSCEDDGLEDQMLTAALVNSVVDSGSQSVASHEKPPSPRSAALRKRRRPGEIASEGTQPLFTPSAPPGQRTAMITNGRLSLLPATSISQPPATIQPGNRPGIAPKPPNQVTSAPYVAKQPMTAGIPSVTATGGTKPIYTPSTNTTKIKHESKPIAEGRSLADPSTLGAKGSKKPRTQKSSMKKKSNNVKKQAPRASPPPQTRGLLIATSGAVPNPLMHSTPPPVAPVRSAQKAHAGTAAPAPSVPFPLSPSVPCPLEAQSAGVPPEKKVTISEPPSTRTRIFSVDLDPSTFDFSGMANDPNDIVKAEPGDIASSDDLALFKRDRAFSFEFFNFAGDDLLPPPPAPAATTSALPDPATMEDFSSSRPRGDSIIFDPSSFQDGGIHEKNAIMKVNAAKKVETTPRALLADSRLAAPPSATHPSTVNTIVIPSHPVTIPDMEPLLVDPSGNDDGQLATLPSGLTMGNANGNTPATFQMELLNKDGRIGIYLPEARRARIARFHAKRKMRIWRKRIKYDCRKKLADSRPRIKGRFVKRSDMDE